MASLDFLQMRSAAAKKCVRRTTEAAGVPLRIIHVGTGTTQTPTVVLSSTSSTLTLVDGAAASTAIDLSNASYNTLGELADYINSLSSWECKILDGLRADLTDNQFTDGAVTPAVVNGEMCWSLTQLVIAGAKMTVRACYDETVGALRVAGSHRVTLNGFSSYATCTGGANTVQIWDSYKGTDTQIWGALGINNTLLTYAAGNASYPFSGITADDGHELVIVITGTVTTAATTNYVQAEFTRE
jgi:hypothetical protein